MIRVSFSCGHETKFEASVTSRPVCLVCGESRIQRTDAPAPRFTGMCSGPSATMKALEPWAEKLEA